MEMVLQSGSLHVKVNTVI